MPNSKLPALNLEALRNSNVISEQDTPIMKLLKRIRFQQEREKSLREHGIE